ncbi:MULTISPECIES: helix-turn-helix domain-containing protein [Paenibacillus]|uniref:Helix-turn-helix domain-containing protein n=1 Tax=Paenibacillus illinoisensis TaxID=59845 RepID=A0ABW8HQQ8_9BACL
MNEPVLRLVGQRVRELRKKQGYSQEELGEMAGFHFSYIGGVERAEKNITLLNLQKIADALKVNVHELFVYSKFVKSGTNDKEKLLNEINEKLWPMKSSDLKKVNLLLSEFFDS